MPSFFFFFNWTGETEGNNNFGKADTGPDSVSKDYSYYSVNQIQSTHEQNELAFMSEIFFHFIFLIWADTRYEQALTGSYHPSFQRSLPSRGKISNFFRPQFPHLPWVGYHEALQACLRMR